MYVVLLISVIYITFKKFDILSYSIELALPKNSYSICDIMTSSFELRIKRGYFCPFFVNSRHYLWLVSAIYDVQRFFLGSI